MSFHFPLQAVLQFRASIEHQQELRLRAANQQVARMSHLVELLKTRMQELRVKGSQQMSAGTTAAELGFQLLCETAVTQQQKELEREVQRLQRLRDEQQKTYQQARRQRETLEGLRDRQLREYQRDVKRHQQSLLDELFLMRRSYLKRG
jgi:flagellar export protein FliJ